MSAVALTGTEAYARSCCKPVINVHNGLEPTPAEQPCGRFHLFALEMQKLGGSSRFRPQDAHRFGSMCSMFISGAKPMPQSADTHIRATVQGIPAFLPLDLEQRTHVDTSCAAHHLGRKAQTMRVWADPTSSDQWKVELARG